MKTIAITVFLIYFGTAIHLQAGYADPSVGPLKLLTYPSYTTEGATEAQPATMILTVYLENTGTGGIRVVTGKLIRASISTRDVWYYADLKRTPNGRVVKPTPVELDIIELKPGDIVELETVVVPVGKSIYEYSAIYEIGESLGAAAECWRGKIKTTFDIPWTDLRAASLYQRRNSKSPNHAPEATTLACTPAADAPVAPAVGRASS